MTQTLFLKFQCKLHLDYQTDSRDKFLNHIRNHKEDDE